MKPFPITAVMQSIAAELPKANVRLVTATPAQRIERLEFLRSLPSQSRGPVLGGGALYNKLGLKNE
jgi:hypothetical protein